MKNYSRLTLRRARTGMAVAVSLATLGTGLALSATALASADVVPALAETECNNAGGGCHIEDLSSPPGCHVYVGSNDRIYAHTAACGYGTVSGPNHYVDYEGSF